MAECDEEAIYRREWLTVPQVAKRLGLSPERIRAAIRLGQLAHYCPPGCKTVRLFWPEVEAWMRSHALTPPSSSADPSPVAERSLHPVAERQLARARAKAERDGDLQ